MCYIQTKASTVKITKITYWNFNAFDFRLLNEIDEINNVSIRYKDDIIQLRKESGRLKEELKVAYAGCHALKNDVDDKQRLIEKHEIDMKKQMEIFKCLNNEVLKQINLLNLCEKKEEYSTTYVRILRGFSFALNSLG